MVVPTMVSTGVSPVARSERYRLKEPAGL